MANLYDSSAMGALNEDAYINKLYDNTLDSQKKALQQGYDSSSKQLTTGQQHTQKQTSDYVKRAYVEGGRASGNMQTSTVNAQNGGAPGLGSTAATAQARLTMANQQQANVSALKNQQTAADLEYERIRKLRGEQFAAQIKQAQADNDMARAQALYDAAKAEEAQLRSLRESGALLMASKNDNSILDAIARGEAVARDTTTPTWDNVLKNEESINKIYDAQMESQRQQAQMQYAEDMSELEAQQREAQRETDKNLTNAYVDALKRNQNYQEVQNAYGQGSGTAMQARLAREAGLVENLTKLRTLQLGKDSAIELQKANLVHTLGQNIAKAQAETDKNRAGALYDAAEKEEQMLVEDQKLVGEQLAKDKNYSVLGKLYGLTQDQINKLMGRGSGGGGGGGSSGGSSRDGKTTNSSGTTVGANSSIIPLGQGPISSANLQSQVASGNVTALTNNGKVTYVSTPKGPTGGITGAAIKASQTSSAQTSSAQTSSKGSSLGSVLDRVVSAIKKATSKK